MQFFGPSPAPAIVPVPAPAPAPIHAFAEQEAEVVPLAARPPIPLAAPLVGLPPAPVPLLHRAPIGPAPIDYEEVISFLSGFFALSMFNQSQ